jgi:hypothetical protein
MPNAAFRRTLTIIKIQNARKQNGRLPLVGRPRGQASSNPKRMCRSSSPVFCISTRPAWVISTVRKRTLHCRAMPRRRVLKCMSHIDVIKCEEMFGLDRSVPGSTRHLHLATLSRDIPVSWQPCLAGY